MDIDREQYARDGYVIRDVLPADDLAALREAADALMARPALASQRKFHYLSILVPALDARALHRAIHLPAVLETVEALLGPDLRLDNAALLAAEPGVVYTQGWHRDVLQVPQDQIDERMFSADWFHNNVQLNLALTEDRCFWAVKGSHRRPNTEAERATFGGSRHMSPVGAAMPDGEVIALKPGQAVFYNNNLIHRGFADPVQTRRRTLHLGYHTATRPPTWHFYGLQTEALTPEYLSSLEPTVRTMLEAHLARRAAFPDVTKTYHAG
jgi:hypothetical protein